MVAAIGMLVGYTGVGSLTAAGVTLASGGVLTLAGMAVNLGGALLLSAATAPGVPSPENVQSNSKNAVAPRVRHYGIVKVGGNAVFHRAKSGKAFRVIVHGHGEITRVLQYYLNNELVTLDASGWVTDEQYYHKHNRVRILARKGLVPETHYPEITSVWDEWTDQHRLDGLFTSLLISEEVPPDEYGRVYPNGEPEIVALAETSKCLDPRSGDVAFTENMALAIADYVSSKDGFNRPNLFDLADIKEQADICDQIEVLTAGGSESRYRVSGSYLLNEKPEYVLRRMLDACAGRMRLKPSGKVGLKVGVWQDPEFALQFGDILEVQEINNGPDLLDRYNELPARFVSHDLSHVEVDAEPWLDLNRVEDDGEVLTGPAKSLHMCPSHRQARQVMKIFTERDNPSQIVTLLCKPKALPAIYEDVVSLDVPELGLEGPYEVARHTLSFDQGRLRAVGLVLRKVNPEAFTLSPEEQGAVQEMPEEDTSEGVPIPQNVVAAPAGLKIAGNAWAAAIGVAWDAPDSDVLVPYLKVAPTGTILWREIVVANGATSAIISDLDDGSRYDVSLAFRTSSGGLTGALVGFGSVTGEAVVVVNVLAAAVSDPPLAPTNLQISDSGGGIALVEIIASSSEGLWKTEVYRDAVLVGVIYAAPSSEIAFLDNCGSGTFSWTARSVNVSGIPSDSDAGPVVAAIV